METKPMDKAAEDRLLGAVKEAVAWVEDGTDPTEAIVKVARDNKLNSDTTSLLVQAYNTGRTTFQREKCANDILCKMAEFPIVRIEDVRQQLWPDEPMTPKQASAAAVRDFVPDCYSRPPRMPEPKVIRTTEKTASATTIEEPKAGDPQIKMAKAYGQAQRLGKQVEEARYQSKVAQDRMISAMSKLADYFQEDPLFRRPFSEVEYNAKMLYGTFGKQAMDYVYSRNRLTEKRAASAPRNPAPVRETEQPYSLLKAVSDAGYALQAAKEAHAKLQKEAQAKVQETLAPFCELPSNDPPRISVLGSGSDSSQSNQPSYSKQASIFGNILTGSTVASINNATRGQDSSFKKTQDMVESAKQDLSDPDHMNSLRQIEAQTMLHDFLTNDEVLSGYDPEEVLQAYNEISQLSPHSAVQPAVMRPLLRKRLTQGSYEPFEAQQIADIEKSVATNQKPPTIKLSEVIRGSSLLG